MASKLAKKKDFHKHKKVLKSAVFEAKFNDVLKLQKVFPEKSRKL
jgi:hypothetical protein